MLTIRQALLTIVAVSVAIFVLFMTIRPAPAQFTADEWWMLVLQLQADPRVKNEPDRRFLKQMVNELSVTGTSIPTVAQQKWLLSIQHELERRK